MPDTLSTYVALHDPQQTLYTLYIIGRYVFQVVIHRTPIKTTVQFRDHQHTHTHTHTHTQSC